MCKPTERWKPHKKKWAQEELAKELQNAHKIGKDTSNLLIKEMQIKTYSHHIFNDLIYKKFIVLEGTHSYNVTMINLWRTFKGPMETLI